MPADPKAPPSLLQIFRERLRPGSEAKYSKLEEEALNACRTLGAPNRYLALVEWGATTEVWWLNMYDSQAAVDCVSRSYAAKPALMRALAEILARKAGLTTPPVDVMTRFRSEFSSGEPWTIGELEYVVVRELSVAMKSAGAVFEAPDGSAFSLLGTPDFAGALQAANQLGHDAHILRTEPRWSFPAEQWIAKNPRLWQL